jgi:cytochrome c-type biogenesis protein CcmE
MKLHISKITKIFLPMLLISIGLYILISSMNENITFYTTPSEVTDEKKLKNIRLGGYVKKGTVDKIDARTINFIVTDHKTDVEVKFTGFVPNLFKDEQGVIIYGKFKGNTFYATELLAKHDENYYPKK